MRGTAPVFSARASAGLGADAPACPRSPRSRQARATPEDVEKTAAKRRKPGIPRAGQEGVRASWAHRRAPFCPFRGGRRPFSFFAAAPGARGRRPRAGAPGPLRAPAWRERARARGPRGAAPRASQALARGRNARAVQGLQVLQLARGRRSSVSRSRPRARSAAPGGVRTNSLCGTARAPYGAGPRSLAGLGAAPKARSRNRQPVAAECAFGRGGACIGARRREVRGGARRRAPCHAPRPHQPHETEPPGARVLVLGGLFEACGDVTLPGPLRRERGPVLATSARRPSTKRKLARRRSRASHCKHRDARGKPLARGLPASHQTSRGPVAVT